MAPVTKLQIKYINPYSTISKKYSNGLDAVAAAIAPEEAQDIALIVDAVYNYVTTTYGLALSTLKEENVKALITSTINSYLNYQLFYSPQQMQFIHQLIGGTIACGNPEDIQAHILNVEQEIAQSGMTVAEQMPLLYATAVGNSAYSYWALIVANPEGTDWKKFVTGFTPPIVKFPYWVASAMQGTLIGLDTLSAAKGTPFESALQILLDATGADILLTLFGSLAVNSSKVVFNLQQQAANGGIGSI